MPQVIKAPDHLKHKGVSIFLHEQLNKWQQKPLGDAGLFFSFIPVYPMEK